MNVVEGKFKGKKPFAKSRDVSNVENMGSMFHATTFNGE
jgi:hypothetical protein